MDTAFGKPKIKLTSILIYVFLFLALGIGIFVTQNKRQDIRNRAGFAGASVSLNPSSTNASANSEIKVGIIVNAGTYNVTGAQLQLIYDPSLIQITDFVAGKSLPVVLTQPKYGTGEFTVTLGATPQSYLQGSDVVGTITAKVLSRNPSAINIGEMTMITALESTTNIYNTGTGIAINGETGTPTPTPASSGYRIEFINGLAAGEIITLSTNPNTGHGVNAVLYNNNAVVTHQEGFTYQWSVDNPNILSFSTSAVPYPNNMCAYGIYAPCPISNIQLKGRSVGQTTIRLNIVRNNTDSFVASASFPVIVSNTSITPTWTPSPTSLNNNPPVCGQSTIQPPTGIAPLTVTLHGAGSAGSGPGIDGYRWDFENNGSWDTGTSLNPVTHTYTSPGSYTPVYQVHGVNNIWSQTCTYPYTITVQGSSSGNQTLEFKVKLAGVTDGSADGAKMTVKFTKTDGTILQLSQPLTLSYVSGGVYKATAVLTNPFPAGTKFRITLKGERHVAIKFCKQVGQTGPCTDTEYITVPSPVPLTYGFDLTGLPLPAGDVPPQDGKVDATDMNAVKTLMSKLCSALTADDKKKGDLDYSGCVNVKDIFLIRQTLETRYDE